MSSDLTTQQRVQCGEILVQYVLLKHGIESAHLTTDTGIDLVVYPRTMSKAWPFDRPATIQVKTSTHRQVSEGYKGYIGWFIPDDCPADFAALVDLDMDKLWLLPKADFDKKSTKARKGYRGLWWSITDSLNSRQKRREIDFAKYEMDDGIINAFGV